jgi:hypothetical protein
MLPDTQESTTLGAIYQGLEGSFPTQGRSVL